MGDHGLILQSKDGGVHWVKQASDSEISLMRVFFVNEKRGVAVGEQGTVLWTENGGSLCQSSPLEWTKLLPANLMERGIYAPNLYDVFFLDEAHGWIAGDAGTVLFSADGGKSWRLLMVGFFPPLYSLDFKDGSEGCGVGAGGNLTTEKKYDLGTQEAIQF